MTRLERFASGLLEAGWLAAVVLTPMFIDKNGADVFEGAKSGLLQSLALLMLAAWAARVLTSEVRPGNGAERVGVVQRLRTPVIGAAVALLSVHCVSTLFSLSPSESLWGHAGRSLGLLTLLSYGAIFAAMLANLRTHAQLRRLVTALIVPSIPVVGYAIAQRLRLEPLTIAMRETDIQRATSLLGQPVFLAAYLAMVFPFTAMRLRELRRAPPEPGTHRRLAIGVHAFVLTLQGIGILITESRGPLLGLLLGVGMVALVLAVRHDHRKLLRGVLVCGAIGLATVFVVAPALRDSANPEVRRLAIRVSDTFATSGGGGQFRTTTWNVATRVLTNRAPLELADGTHDARAGLRWLIGYGPELQYAVAPPFYDDELPKLFNYFLADRLHHELWDAVIVTGVLGLAAAVALQAALFYGLFRGLGLVVAAQERRNFWLAFGGGGACGALAACAMRGFGFVFLGLQLGALVGLALMLMVLGLRRRGSGSDAAPAGVGHEPMMLAILAAFVSHFVETSFSFSVVTTGAIFWVLCALVPLLTLFIPAADEPASNAARATEETDRTAWRDPIASGALLAWLTITLGFVFLGGVRLDPKPGALLWDSISLLSEPPRLRAPVVPILVLGSVLLAAFVLALAPRGAGRAPLFARRLRWTLGIGLAVGAAFWLRMSTLLAKRGALSKIPGRHAIDNIVLRVDAVESFYVWTGLVFVLAALHLGVSTKVSPLAPVRWWRTALSAACLAAALAMFGPITLRPAEASAAVALGNTLRDERQMLLAEEAFSHAAKLLPHSSSHSATLAKTYNTHGRADKTRAPVLFQLANQAMLDAIERNPADGENMTNLALIRSNWASHLRSRELIAELPKLYGRALRLNPKDPRLWEMWANVQLKLLQDSSGALQSAQRALALAPSNKTAGLVEQIQARIASRDARLTR